MKHRLVTLKSAIFASLLTGFCANSFAEHNEHMKQNFWGELYKDGGTTFYSHIEFTTKTPLISESYIYSSALIRDHLQCGTNRQCLKKNDEYRRIMSDLHNIVPADSYLSFKLERSVYGILDDSAPFVRGTVRKQDHVIEPPEEVKGDIARAILYMHKQYQLPLSINFSLLELWNQNDPPSKSEMKKNIKIATIQGNKNQFISNPAMINVVER